MKDYEFEMEGIFMSLKILLPLNESQIQIILCYFSFFILSNLHLKKKNCPIICTVKTPFLLRNSPSVTQKAMKSSKKLNIYKSSQFPYNGHIPLSLQICFIPMMIITWL